MKTYEGSMTIRWYKNDNGGDRRPLTYCCENIGELNDYLKEVESDFKTIPHPDDIERYKRYAGQLAYSVMFDMSERN